MDRSDSKALGNRAREVVPGGVHSYARYFDREINFAGADGSRIHDVDGNEYVDYLQAWGAIVLGHCDEAVNAAALEAASTHDLYGYGTTELEVEVAETISRLVPSAEKVLFGTTGSEVVGSAIRLARGVTGGTKIIKFQGHYNGRYDAVAMNHLSDREHLGSPDPITAGMLESTMEETIVLPFNDLGAVEAAVAEHGDDIAGIILEPVAHNMGCIPPVEGYLKGLREIADANDILLIFDEVITGFRHDLGGVQKLEGVTPDLTTMGKSVANGYPLSVLCGRAEYMNEFAMAGGDVSFGGTYNAQGGAMGAAKATLDRLETGTFHTEAIEHRDRICAALEEIIEDEGLTATVRKYGTVFLTYFMEPPIKQYRDLLEHDTETYLTYRREMIDRGVMMVPKEARRNYITESHTDADAERTIEAAKDVLPTLAQ